MKISNTAKLGLALGFLIGTVCHQSWGLNGAFFLNGNNCGEKEPISVYYKKNWNSKQEGKLVKIVKNRKELVELLKGIGNGSQIYAGVFRRDCFTEENENENFHYYWNLEDGKFYADEISLYFKGKIFITGST